MLLYWEQPISVGKSIKRPGLRVTNNWGKEGDRGRKEWGKGEGRKERTKRGREGIPRSLYVRSKQYSLKPQGMWSTFWEWEVWSIVGSFNSGAFRFIVCQPCRKEHSFWKQRKGESRILLLIGYHVQQRCSSSMVLWAPLVFSQAFSLSILVLSLCLFQGTRKEGRQRVTKLNESRESFFSKNISPKTFYMPDHRQWSPL